MEVFVRVSLIHSVIGTRTCRLRLVTLHVVPTNPTRTKLLVSRTPHVSMMAQNPTQNLDVSRRAAKTIQPHVHVCRRRPDVIGRDFECPSLDLFFVFPSTIDFRQSFGLYPNGYYGFLNLLRDWIHDLPLTNTSYKDNVILNASQYSGTMRLALITYGDITVPYTGNTTEGNLTGSYKELMADIAKFSNTVEASPTSYVKPALDLVTSNADLYHTTGRKKIVFTFVTQELNDKQMDLMSEKADLEDKEMESNMIVIRPQVQKVEKDSRT
eukprot:PhF_6_TR27447/c0_g1_i1/m.40354